MTDDGLVRREKLEDSLSSDLVTLFEDARSFASEAKSQSTQRAYRTDWKLYSTWCDEHGLSPLPSTAETVAMYISHLARSGRKASTIDRKLVSISQAHKMRGLDTPTSTAVVRETLKGLKRKIGTAQDAKAPVVVERLRKMLAALPDRTISHRNRALLLLGFAGAFRRSELISIDVEDLSYVPEGMVILLRRSKTDQEGAGRKIAIPFGHHEQTCPVRATKLWLESAMITDGPVFRSVNRHGHISSKRLSPHAVACIIKKLAATAGLDPKMFSGHSLRAGLATSAAQAGKSERAIMATTGHRSERMLRKYIRESNLFTDCAAEGLL